MQCTTQFLTKCHDAAKTYTTAEKTPEKLDEHNQKSWSVRFISNFSILKLGPLSQQDSAWTSRPVLHFILYVALFRLTRRLKLNWVTNRWVVSLTCDELMRSDIKFTVCTAQATDLTWWNDAKWCSSFIFSIIFGLTFVLGVLLVS